MKAFILKFTLSRRLPTPKMFQEQQLGKIPMVDPMDSLDKEVLMVDQMEDKVDPMVDPMDSLADQTEDQTDSLDKEGPMVDQTLDKVDQTVDNPVNKADPKVHQTQHKEDTLVSKADSRRTGWTRCKQVVPMHSLKKEVQTVDKYPEGEEAPTEGAGLVGAPF